MVQRIYGYARVSTPLQKISRQVDNIRKNYPEAVIIEESYTGTKMDRPAWNKMYKNLRDGDTVVFDEVSRMSRDAEDGFRVYQELFDRGVNLVFLKESTLNTDNFKNVAQIPLTGNDIDSILEGINVYLMKVAENQIRAAFRTAQHEVEFLHKRTSEGVRRAQAEGKQVGIAKGTKLTTKKSVEAKEKMLKYSKAFNGTLNDTECIQLIGINRNSYYKYKRELMAEITD